MAARTVSNFLETGEIVNSVNFPETTLETRGDTTLRIAVVNENKPGTLADILTTIGKFDLNITQQVNKSRGEIAYNVIDMELGDAKKVHEVQEALVELDGVKSSRIIANTFGPNYEAANRRSVDALLSENITHSRYWVKRD